TEREEELHWNAYTDVMLFLNLTVGAVVIGCILVADQIAHDGLHDWSRAAYVAPFVAAYFLYRCSIGAAERLGTERRASLDLHRFDVYRALGIEEPLTHSEERDTIAPAV